ncbi:MAG: GlsB/YeaQ/YmgE family stress response membrane protein [Ktedonobacteraceae bacterium]|nr:GlsB/YeaQ/YmgE family stress response membrane protein [Chloroflexota bacterium]
MLAHMLPVLADGVTIKIGDNVWSFGLNFILYLIIAAVVGLIAEYIVGSRIPFGFVGAILLAIVGIWLMTQVIVITGIPDIYLWGVPIIRALIGAIILVAIWHLITYGFRRRRYRTAS